jgi:hypothetical protein
LHARPRDRDARRQGRDAAAQHALGRHAAQQENGHRGAVGAAPLAEIVVAVSVANKVLFAYESGVREGNALQVAQAGMTRSFGGSCVEP